MSSSEREQFEARIKRDGGDLRTFGSPPNMHYSNSAVNNAWTGWQAARRAQASAESQHPYVEGGRESVEDALAIVESFGTGIEGVNDEFARQIILAAEVRRLRGLYEQAVGGRSAFRQALRKARAAILPPLGCPACGITHDAEACPSEAAYAVPQQAPLTGDTVAWHNTEDGEIVPHMGIDHGPPWEPLVARGITAAKESNDA